MLAERAGVNIPEVEYSKEAKERADLKATLLEINKLAAKYFYAQLKTEQGKLAHTYLTGRGPVSYTHLNTGIINLLTVSIPFSTPRRTMIEVNAIKRQNHPIGSPVELVKVEK